MASKSFADRLAALEALEAAADAKQEECPDPPDSAALDREQVLAWLVVAIRTHHIARQAGEWQASGIYDAIGCYAMSNDWRPVWGVFWRALAERAAEMISGLFLPLYDDEATQVIDAIDDGLLDLVWLAPNEPHLGGFGHRYASQGSIPTDQCIQFCLYPRDTADRELYRVADNVTGAMEFWRSQLGAAGPQLRTLADWRAWLVQVRDS